MTIRYVNVNLAIVICPMSRLNAAQDPDNLYRIELNPTGNDQHSTVFHYFMAMAKINCIFDDLIFVPICLCFRVSVLIVCFVLEARLNQSVSRTESSQSISFRTVSGWIWKRQSANELLRRVKAEREREREMSRKIASHLWIRWMKLVLRTGLEKKSFNRHLSIHIGYGFGGW